jgi:hypothetical protein
MRPAAWVWVICFLVASNLSFCHRGVVLAQSVPAIAPAIDVELSRDGLLTGRVVDARGQAIADGEVTVLGREAIVSHVKTDREGNFRVPNMQAGMFRLVSKEVVQVCRVWSPGTAPPSAQRSALLVASTEVAAGQVAPLRYWLGNPNVIGGIAAIVIATPIIANNIRQDRKGS